MGKGVFGLKEEAALARTVIKKRLAGQPAPDIWFLIILMLLVCYGLVMLFSAGYAVALYRRGDAYTYIRPQLLFAAFVRRPCTRPVWWITTSGTNWRGQSWGYR